jgi:predicted transcriptional regulator
MRKSKPLKDQVQKQEENEKAELEAIREDNIETAKTKIENNLIKKQ